MNFLKCDLIAVHEIYAEVLQSRVLGPILFLLYTADVPVPFLSLVEIPIIRWKYSYSTHQSSNEFTICLKFFSIIIAEKMEERSEHVDFLDFKNVDSFSQP